MPVLSLASPDDPAWREREALERPSLPKPAGLTAPATVGSSVPQTGSCFISSLRQARDASPTPALSSP